jgi:hypothetical protein
MEPWHEERPIRYVRHRGRRPPNNPPVNPEVLKSVEAGVKSEWLDHHLQVNLSAFHYNEQNLQMAIIVAGGPKLINAASAEVNGGEPFRQSDSHESPASLSSSSQFSPGEVDLVQPFQHRRMTDAEGVPVMKSASAQKIGR